MALIARFPWDCCRLVYLTALLVVLCEVWHCMLCTRKNEPGQWPLYNTASVLAACRRSDKQFLDEQGNLYLKRAKSCVNTKLNGTSAWPVAFGCVAACEQQLKSLMSGPAQILLDSSSSSSAERAWLAAVYLRSRTDGS